MSIFHLSINSSKAPNEVTASTKNKQLFFLQISPIPSKGCNTPVEVSAWTIAKIDGLWVSIAYLISS